MDMTGVEKAPEATIVTKTAEPKVDDGKVDDGTVKMEETPTVVVNGVSDANGDAPENCTEVNGVTKVEVTDIKKDGEAEDTAVAKEKADVAAEKNELVDGKAEGNTEVVLGGKKEEPSKTVAEVVPNENSVTVVEENIAPEEKSVENGNVQLSEAPTETQSENKSEPAAKEMKLEPAIVSQIEKPVEIPSEDKSEPAAKEMKLEPAIVSQIEKPVEIPSEDKSEPAAKEMKLEPATVTQIATPAETS